MGYNLKLFYHSNKEQIYTMLRKVYFKILLIALLAVTFVVSDESAEPGDTEPPSDSTDPREPEVNFPDAEDAPPEDEEEKEEEDVI